MVRIVVEIETNGTQEGTELVSVEGSEGSKWNLRAGESPDGLLVIGLGTILDTHQRHFSVVEGGNAS